MEYLFIDESGSNTNQKVDQFPYFVICLIRVFDKEKLKKVLKRFISKYYNDLKNIDNGKMFKNNKFYELKGSSLNVEMKYKLAKYLAQSNLFEVYYIIVDNKNIEKKFFLNKNRTFNFLLDIFLYNNLLKNNLPYSNYIIQIDERNLKLEATKSLQEYLAIQLSLKNDLIEDITVEYFDSENNSFIQISDFFSNLYYSYLMRPNNYIDIIEYLKKENIIKDIFNFPKNKKQ